jgi:TPP-dependent pyruvate/acetoin dehydrogenase alpha subunit
MNKNRESSGLLLAKIFFEALRIRRVEEAIANRYAEGKMRCPVHLSIGQEIPAAVIGQLRERNDTFISSHRAHAHYLASGGSLPKMIAEIYGRIDGCAKGRGGSMHLFDKESGFLGSSAIVGNSIPVGVGLGYSYKLKEKDSISFVFFGDGATEEGVFYESLNFASIHSLPVVFVCENNRYSVYTGLVDRQPSSRHIYKVAESLGVSSLKVSDFEVGATLMNISDLIKDCRLGKGPKLIEFETFRYLEHCGPNDDDKLNYRSEEELKIWKDQDRLAILRNLLLEEKLITEDSIMIKESEWQDEIYQAFIFAEESRFPSLEEVLGS